MKSPYPVRDRSLPTLSDRLDQIAKEVSTAVDEYTALYFMDAVTLVKMGLKDGK